jgi:hypothetical protein
LKIEDCPPPAEMFADVASGFAFGYDPTGRSVLSILARILYLYATITKFVRSSKPVTGMCVLV